MNRNSLAHTAALCLLAALAVPPAARASGIANGNFATGDFTGWTRDTDGAGLGSSGSDFAIVGAPGPYSARIEADYSSTPGDISSVSLDSVLFANTLTQALDTTLPPGAAIRLTFDWLFTGEDGDPTSGDIFSVALNDGLGNLYGADGLPGFLIDPRTLYGSGSFSALLDTASFGNRTGWWLDFQLGVGIDPLGQPNGFGSAVQIGNVALTEVFAAPIPAPLALVLLGLPVLASSAKPARPRGKNR
jgi:hypothetical protein